MGSHETSHRPAPRVLVYYDQADVFRPQLSARFPTVEFTACRSQEELAGLLDALKPQVIFAYKFGPQPFPRPAFLACQSLEWLSVAFAGLDVLLPFDDATLTVTNASGVAATEMGHYAIAAILGLFQDFPGHYANQAARKWHYHEIRSARNATIGIVGLGRSGRVIARMARAVGLRVVACRMRAEPSAEVDRVYAHADLHQMLGTVDATVLCAPLTSLTRDLFDEKAFAAMKRGSYFVNIARGAIVREEALIDALKSGQLGGAVIDVTRTEPLPAASPLWDAPNLFITPHCSSEYDGWVSDAASMFADNLERWIEGRPLENRVRSDRGY